MAKRKATGRAKAAKSGRKSQARRRSVKRPKVRAARARKAPRAGKARKSARRGSTARRPKTRAAVRGKTARLDRERRRLAEDVVPTPPSSLNMNRRGSAARTGRAELEESLHEHSGMTPALTGGDVDADWEEAYFSGDEAPGGDNPTPDQDVVEDIGKSLGVEYQDTEELKSTDKVVERDKHRWELDPASAEDYKERK